MTRHFENSDQARAAALKRWSDHPKRFNKHLVTISCAKCKKTYKTQPKNVNDKYDKHYCRACRKKNYSRPTAYKPGQCLGEKNTNAKLTEKEVIAIRFLYKEGYSFRYLAKRYQVQINTIYEICSFRRWKHIVS